MKEIWRLKKNLNFYFLFDFFCFFFEGKKKEEKKLVFRDEHEKWLN